MYQCSTICWTYHYKSGDSSTTETVEDFDSSQYKNTEKHDVPETEIAYKSDPFQYEIMTKPMR